MRDYDVIVVGAGHNALVTACYLAQAGHRVGVFERRDQVGGAVSTREIVPGYRFDLGGSAHILIRLTPIVEELGLGAYGLEYLEVDPLSAPFLLWQPLYHEGGIARPRGGSGMLSEALRAHLEAHGGAVHLSAPVDRILVEGKRAVGVRVGNDVYTARAVVAGTHAFETYGRLLEAEHRPPGAAGMRAGNGFGAVLRLALSEPIEYTAHPGREARVGLQLLCPDRAHLAAAYADYLRGAPAADPPIVAMSFSAVDDTLAPPGCEVLWLWAQYFPYELAHGEWSAVAPAVEESILRAFERYAPGTRGKVVGSLFQHPLWLERELGLYRGNVMHLEMSVSQMFALRPFAGAAGYRAHLRGLYLTGASTHPGGGIMGASGRNAARVLLRDLQRRRV